MSGKAEKLFGQALRLPTAARAALAGRLIDSLDEEVDEGAEEAWAKEIERRVREIESGAVQMIPWSQVRRDILKSRRAKKRR